MKSYLLGGTVLLGWCALGVISPVCGQAFPTNFEQYQLELINRARADPQAEVVRLSGQTWGDDPNQVPGTAYPQPQPPSLDEGLPPGTITPTPKQPLTFNLDLIEAAREYSNTLLTNNSPLTHTFGGTTSQGRMAAAGYTFSPLPAGSGENLSIRASSAPLPIMTGVVTTLHDQLVIDGNVEGRGHRQTIFNGNFREVGIGLGASTTYQGFGPGLPHAVLATQDFAFTNSNPFITGVVFNDTVMVDGFYTPDEGLGAVTIIASPVGGGVPITATTYGSGGYSLQVPPGTYTVSATGPFGTTPVGVANVTAQNVKVDVINPIPEPGSLALVCAGVFGGVMGRRRRH
jgi:hypothetical protein